MPPREWAAWRAYWRVRPREDLYHAAAEICCTIQQYQVGGSPRIADYYPRTSAEAEAAEEVSPEQFLAAFDRAFG